MSVRKLVKKVKNAFKKAFVKKEKKIKTTTVTKIHHHHGPKKMTKPVHDDDYVSEDELDKISGDSISLYTCEMPEERLAKIKALMKTNVYNMNASIQHHRHPLSSSMMHGGNGQKKDDFADFRQIRDECVFLVPDDEDYMNMEEPNYEDFMDFSDLKVTSTSLLNAALEAEAPPPYSEEDPNAK